MAHEQKQNQTPIGSEGVGDRLRRREEEEAGSRQDRELPGILWAQPPLAPKQRAVWELDPSSKSPLWRENLLATAGFEEAEGDEASQ